MSDDHRVLIGNLRRRNNILFAWAVANTLLAIAAIAVAIGLSHRSSSFDTLWAREIVLTDAMGIPHLQIGANSRPVIRFWDSGNPMAGERFTSEIGPHHYYMRSYSNSDSLLVDGESCAVILSSSHRGTASLHPNRVHFTDTRDSTRISMEATSDESLFFLMSPRRNGSFAVTAKNDVVLNETYFGFDRAGAGGNTPKLVQFANKGGASTIYYRDGFPKISIGMSTNNGRSDQTPRIAIYGDSGFARVALGVVPLANPAGTTTEGTLTLFDETGRLVTRIPE